MGVDKQMTFPVVTCVKTLTPAEVVAFSKVFSPKSNRVKGSNNIVAEAMDCSDILG